MKRKLLITLLLSLVLSGATWAQYTGYYIAGKRPRTENAYGNYLVGLQSNMVAWIQSMGRNPQTFLPSARRSPNQVAGQYVWLIEAWSVPLREIERGRRTYNIYTLAHHQAVQLGNPFEYVKGANGNRLIDSTGAYVLTEKEEIINWLWTLDNQTSPPVSFATNQEILSWITTRNLRTKWEALFDAFYDATAFPSE